LHNSRDTINDNIKGQAGAKLTNIYSKHVYNPAPADFDFHPLKKVIKRHKLTCFEQRLIQEAFESKTDIKYVFEDKFLQKTLNLID
jgi:hypothetical protein